MVLEARENAEKVGYPVVGEEVKDASNVIDYDIHDEVTIDTSSVFNANNDTTTGMANVIPGVNAPKLIADTSIYGTGVDTRSAGCNLYHDVYFWMSLGLSPKEYDAKTFTISSEVGELQFTQGANGIIIPKTCTYLMDIEFAKGYSDCKYDSMIMEDDTVLYTFNGDYGQLSNNTAQVFLPLHKGKSLWVKMIAYLNDNVGFYVQRNINIKIQSIT